MKFKLIALAGASIAVMSCTPALELPTELVTYTRSSNFQTAGLTSNHTTTFRTRVSGSGIGTEVAANCDLVGNGFTAKFNTPAQVALPDYGSATGAIKVTCTHNGASQSTTINGTNLSRKLRDDNTRNAASSQGLLVAIIAEAATAATSADKPGDDWGYPDTTIRFEAATTTAN